MPEINEDLEAWRKKYATIVARPYNLDGRVIPIFIDDAALEEWFGAREVLRLQGYPDRPPDVDTATNRAWVPHPGEPTYHGPRGPEAPRDSIPLEALAIGGPGQLGIKLLVERVEDKIVMRCRRELPDGAFDDWFQIDDVTQEQVDETKEQLIALGRSVIGPDVSIFYTPPEVFEAMYNHSQLVGQAIDEWYAMYGYAKGGA